MAAEVPSRRMLPEHWLQHGKHDGRSRIGPGSGPSGEPGGESEQLRARHVADGVVHQLREGGEERSTAAMQESPGEATSRRPPRSIRLWDGEDPGGDAARKIHSVAVMSSYAPEKPMAAG